MIHDFWKQTENTCLIFHVQLLILFSCFEFFLSSAPEEVKRVFSLQNANQVILIITGKLFFFRTESVLSPEIFIFELLFPQYTES